MPWLLDKCLVSLTVVDNNVHYYGKMWKMYTRCGAVSACTPTRVDFGSKKVANDVFFNFNFNLESFGMFLFFFIWFYFDHVLFNFLFKQVKIFSIRLNKAVMRQISLDFVVAKKTYWTLLARQLVNNDWILIFEWIVSLSCTFVKTECKIWGECKIDYDVARCCSLNLFNKNMNVYSTV